jgi:uncharacterized protein (TIGR00266 family)
MKHEILYGPSYSVARVVLDAGDSIRGESGAMVSMSPNINIETSTGGGLLKGLIRKAVGGESLFQTTFSAEGSAGEVLLAPQMPGDIAAVDVGGGAYFVQSGSFLACSAGMALDTSFGGARSFFSGEGLFLLKASGAGTLFVSSYGALHERVLAEGESYVVDTTHIVAFESTVDYSVKKAAKGWLSSITSGEGLVCEYRGPGRILLQTRSVQSLISWLLPFLPRKN